MPRKHIDLSVSGLHIGAMTPGKRYVVQPRNFAPERVVLDVPTRITNGTSKGIYRGEQWLTRPGSDHSHLPSRGKGC